MKSKKIWSWGGLVLLAICLILCVFSAYMGMGDAVHNGVRIGGISVGNLTKAEAENVISNNISQFLSAPYKIQIDQEEIILRPSDFDVRVDAAQAALDAYSVGRKNFFTRLFESKDAKMPFTYDEEKLLALLSTQNASEKTEYTIEKDRIVVTNGKNTYAYDVQKLAQTVLTHVAYGNTEDITIELSMQSFQPLTAEQLRETYAEVGNNASYARDENGEIVILPETVGLAFDAQEVQRVLDAHTEEGEVFSVPVSVFLPEVTEESLQQLLFRDTLSTYTSHFSEGDRNRCGNIRLAASKINGLTLLPNEEFSYNQTVGERTASNGFGLAHAYVDGQVVDQYGGGICQVSSTLYNAQLFANLKTTERVCHMMTVGYVPLGRDATVDWGTIDYRFVNDREYPIQILIDTASSGTITVTIKGTKIESEPTVKLEVGNTHYIPFNTQTVENHDLPLGEEKVVTKGKNTITCELYRVIVDANGEVISRSFETKSRYRGNDEIKEVGTGMNLPPLDPSIDPAVPSLPTDAAVVEQSAQTPPTQVDQEQITPNETITEASVSEANGQ